MAVFKRHWHLEHQTSPPPARARLEKKLLEPPQESVSEEMGPELGARAARGSPDHHRAVLESWSGDVWSVRLVCSNLGHPGSRSLMFVVNPKEPWWFYDVFLTEVETRNDRSSIFGRVFEGI